MMVQSTVHLVWGDPARNKKFTLNHTPPLNFLAKKGN